MIYRILREISILGYFIFLSILIIGIYTTNLQHHIVLASTEFPDNPLFHTSQMIASVFFFLFGEYTYFLILALFPVALGLLFDNNKFYTLSLRIGIIILNFTILTGIFSHSPEWVSSGIIGSFFNDLFSGLFLHIMSALVLCAISIYQAYFILSDTVAIIENSSLLKSWFKKKILKPNNNDAQKTEPKHPLLLENFMIEQEVITPESIDQIIQLLEKQESKEVLSHMYFYTENTEKFGSLLVEFVRNLYKIQKNGLKAIPAQHEIMSSILDKNTIDAKPIQQNIIEINDYFIEEDQAETILESEEKSRIIEEMLDITNMSLVDQFCIQERLGDVFNSFNSSVKTATEEREIQKTIPESISFMQETFYNKQDQISTKEGSFDDSLISDLQDTLDGILEDTKNNPYEKQGNQYSFELDYSDIQITEEEYVALMSDDFFEPKIDQIEENIGEVSKEEWIYQEEINNADIDGRIVKEELAQQNLEAIEEYFTPKETNEDKQEFVENHIDEILETLYMSKNEGIEESNFLEEEYLYHEGTSNTPGIVIEDLDTIVSKIPIEKTEFQFPPIDLLQHSEYTEHDDPQEKELVGEQIIDILKDFNIQATLEKIIVGPVVTRYEISPPKGLKVNKITELDNNLALGLASKDRIRIEAPVFGKSVVGIEVPNNIREIVSFRDIVENFEQEYNAKDFSIPFLMGKTLEGEILIQDLVKMPHLLIAGSTGSGKSVCVNTLINSILYYKNPDEVKLLLVDPKRVELILYDGLPHLIAPVIKETADAIKALKWLVIHMEERYRILEEKQIRNITEYNVYQEKHNLEKMPYIVVVMDEFADLILLGKRDVEESVIRLAAMARAVGIHLVLATQRPSADVITGLIKANFPSRIAFKVSSKMESRIILDENGAENLLGKGDMLFLSSSGGATTQRIQSPLMNDEEVRAVSYYFKKHYDSNYWEAVLEEEEIIDEGLDADYQDEPMFNEAVQIILKERKTSASYLQRRLKIGYNRAARIIETMEELGILSRANGSKPREILVDEWGV